MHVGILVWVAVPDWRPKGTDVSLAGFSSFWESPAIDHQTIGPSNHVLMVMFMVNCGIF